MCTFQIGDSFPKIYRDCGLYLVNKYGVPIILLCGFWAQATFSNAQNWKTHTPRSNIVGGWARTADFNLDGKPDILIQSGDTIFWYENLRPGWVGHVVDTTFYYSAFALVQVADMDNDGDMDVLKAPTSNSGIDSLSWNENQQNGALWVKHNIVHITGKATDLPNNVGDLDGDGDMDIAFGEYEFANNQPTGSLYWLENKGVAGRWEKHFVRSGNYSYCSLGDMDRDGDLDIMSAGGSLIWIENKLPNSTWEYHDIASGTFFNHHFYGLSADFSNDGIPDLLSTPTAAPANAAAVYTSPDWQRIPISIIPGLFYGALGDVDEDGDLDVFYGGVGNLFRKMGWTENQNDGTTWVQHDIATGSTLQRLPTGLADIDGDGDKDLLAISFNLNTEKGAVFWAENPRISVGTLEAARLPQTLRIVTTPTADVAKIQGFDPQGGIWKGEVYTGDGRLRTRFEVSGNAVFELDVRHFEAGVFIVKMVSGQGQYAVGRFVKL